MGVVKGAWILLSHPQTAMGVVGEARRRLLKMSISLVDGSNGGGGARNKAEMMSKMLRQIGASVFFGVSSVLIITVNKTVLTTYKLVPVQCMHTLQ